MKKIFLTLGILLLFIASAVIADDETTATAESTEDFERPIAPHFTSLDEAIAASSDDRNYLIDFYTDWCVYCKMLDTLVFNQQLMIDYFTNDMTMVKVNAEVDTLLAQKYHVSGYPTAILIHKDGSEIDRIVGYAEKDEYLQMLKDYQLGIGTLDDLLKKIEENFDREMAFEIADKYKYRGGKDEAKMWFTKVMTSGEPGDSLTGEARMSLADMSRRAKEYEDALKGFTAIAADFKGKPIGETAEIYRAIVFGSQGDTLQAIGAFEQFIADHPESEDAEYAQLQIKKLKGEEEPPEEN
ncbi:MAG: thioredoxin domain-containing protein [bacterium]